MHFFGADKETILCLLFMPRFQRVQKNLIQIIKSFCLDDGGIKKTKIEPNSKPF
jgi:hypothetical protein